jgi:hypothetical protein
MNAQANSKNFFEPSLLMRNKRSLKKRYTRNSKKSNKAMDQSSSQVWDEIVVNLTYETNRIILLIWLKLCT